MSLIDDALKRAQSAQGASAPEPGRGGHTPLPLPDPHRGLRRRLGRNGALALIPVAVAAVVFLIVWWRPEKESPPRERSGLALPASALTPTPEAVGATEETTPRLPADISMEVFVPPPAYESRETVAKSPQGVEPAPAPAPAPAPVQVTRDLAPAPRETGVSVTRIEPPSPPMVASGSPMIVRAEEARPAPPARGRSFVREGTAPSGARLTLDGIVYSDTSPAAVVNGRVVSVGSFVEGCEVTRIRPDRVELEDRGATIVLLLK